MRRLLTLAFGILIGQWLSFGGTPAPADLQALGMSAFEREEYGEAARVWSRAVSTHPDNPLFHYLRANALARLGQRQSAAEAYQVALLLEPPADLARMAKEGLASLTAGIADAGPVETTVPLTSLRGVWVTTIILNGTRPARFMVDSGASITVVAQALADSVGLAGLANGSPLELQTLAGITRAPTVRIASLRVGTAEVNDTLAVVHDPGPGIDGILGNDILSRYRVTLDASLALLHLGR